MVPRNSQDRLRCRPLAAVLVLLAAPVVLVGAGANSVSITVSGTVTNAAPSLAAPSFDADPLSLNPGTTATTIVTVTRQAPEKDDPLSERTFDPGDAWPTVQERPGGQSTPGAGVFPGLAAAGAVAWALRRLRA